MLLAAGRAPARHPAADRAPIAIVVEDEPAHEPVPAPPPPAPEPEVNRVAAPVHAALRAPVVHQVAPAEPPVAVAPPVVTAPAAPNDAALPRFTIATSSTPSSASTFGGPVAATPVAVPAGETPYSESAVDVPARAKTKIRPVYPYEAQSSGIEGNVKLEIVVSATGEIQTVRALTRLGYGCEAAAIAAARKTSFTPARKAGRAVPVRMAWAVEFELQ